MEASDVYGLEEARQPECSDEVEHLLTELCLLRGCQIRDVNFSGAGLVSCGDSVKLRLRSRQQFTGDHDPRKYADFSQDLFIAISVTLRP